MKFTNKNYQEKNEKQRTKRFSPTVSFLIVGMLIIMAFFRGTVSHILLITLFTGCGLYKLIQYARIKMAQARRRTAYPLWRTPNYKRYRGNRRSQSYKRNTSYRYNGSYNNHNRLPSNNIRTRNKYRKMNVHKHGGCRNGQNDAV